MNQSRWSSKFAWASLFSLILFVLKNYFNFELLEGDKLIDLILVTATAFGVFNNPTDKNKF